MKSVTLELEVSESGKGRYQARITREGHEVAIGWSFCPAGAMQESMDMLDSSLTIEQLASTNPFTRKTLGAQTK